MGNGGRFDGGVGTVTPDYAELVDQAPEALLAVSPSGEVFAWSRGAATVFGYSAAEAVGQSLYGLIVTPEQRGDAQQRLAEAIERGSLRFEAVRRRKDGSSVRVEVSMRKVDHGEPYVVVCKRPAAGDL